MMIIKHDLIPFKSMSIFDDSAIVQTMKLIMADESYLVYA